MVPCPGRTSWTKSLKRRAPLFVPLAAPGKHKYVVQTDGRAFLSLCLHDLHEPVAAPFLSSALLYFLACVHEEQQQRWGWGAARGGHSTAFFCFVCWCDRCFCAHRRKRVTPRFFLFVPGSPAREKSQLKSREHGRGIVADRLLPSLFAVAVMLVRVLEDAEYVHAVDAAPLPPSPPPPLAPSMRAGAPPHPTTPRPWSILKCRPDPCSFTSHVIGVAQGCRCRHTCIGGGSFFCFSVFRCSFSWSIFFSFSSGFVFVFCNYCGRIRDFGRGGPIRVSIGAIDEIMVPHIQAQETNGRPLR